jgi:TonB family protein
MNSRSLLAASWDIKRFYQRNLVIGFGISSLINLAVVTAVMLLFSGQPKGPMVVPNPYGPLKPIPPPTITRDLSPVSINPETPTKPDFGLIVPVPDDKAPIDNQIKDQNELGKLIGSIPTDLIANTDITFDTQKVLEELLPPPDSFIACEELPVAINMVQPGYPDLARRAGFEATVWVRALIDKDGNVRDVKIVKCSNKDMGFEDAAMAAARESSWKPAIANGHPVAVWITYSVVFKLQ